MFTRRPGLTYEQLREEFSWDLPAELNMGVACADAQDAADLALVDLRRDGEVRRLTFGDLTELSSRFANGLRGIGVEHGDRVGIVLPQGTEVALAHLGVYKLGGIAVPMTQLFGPDALRYRLADSGARAVITDDTTVDKVADVARELGVEVVVAGGPVSGDHHAFDDLVSSGSADLDVPRSGPDDPALLIYTSGTTGAPKGALHGHRVLLGHMPGFELMFDFFPQSGDRMWTPADWAWIGGLLDAVLPAWYHGRPVIAAPRRRFDPEWAIDLMVEHEVTASFLPPTALKLMRQAAVDTSPLSLRTVMSGGEPLGAEMLAWGRDALGVTINEIFGQTEANLLVGNCSVAWEARPGSMGRPYPGHHVAILADDGSIATPGVEGEIVVREPDPVFLLEYWNNPEATEEKFARVSTDGGEERWLRTGDVGEVDDDGYFWFTARADDVIISAGYRIGPAEIEECIMSHPRVAMVAAVGVPDDIRGNVVKAFVQLAEGEPASRELEAEIQDIVRERLAAYEYPREIEFVDELPLTTTGKIRRRDLRQRELERRGSDER